MEVHAPEHPIHTWREFLIHMGTIVLGLLIAIALEQSVEFMHNRHLSHELVEQMRVESEQNHKVVTEDLDNMYRIYGNMTRIRSAIEAGAVNDGKIAFVKPPRSSAGSWYFRTPSRATWTIANAAGHVALLPADKAKAYARLDFSSDFAFQGERDFYRALGEYNNELRLAHINLMEPGPATVTLEQRDAILRTLAAAQSAAAVLTHSLALDQGALSAVRDDVSSVDQLYAYQQRASDQNHTALNDLDR